MRGDSLQREIIEGRMEDKRGRERLRQKLDDGRGIQHTLRKKLNIEKRRAISGLDLPEGRKLKVEEGAHMLLFWKAQLHFLLTLPTIKNNYLFFYFGFFQISIGLGVFYAF